MQEVCQSFWAVRGACGLGSAADLLVLRLWWRMWVRVWRDEVGVGPCRWRPDWSTMRAWMLVGMRAKMSWYLWEIFVLRKYLSTPALGAHLSLLLRPHTSLCSKL